MLRFYIVRPAITKVLIIPISKRLFKVTVISTAKWVRAEEKKSISQKFHPLSRNENNLDILMLTPVQW